jgi:predicted deacylase
MIAAPIVNVPGFIALSRYLPDRRDLNRCFPGSERGSLGARLAHMFLHEVVLNCTHGIDLHTGTVHRDNFPQIRADLDDPDLERLARAFGVPVVINAGYRGGSLRHAAAQRGVRVLVYEAGEALRFDEASIRAGVNGTVRVMRALGMLPKVRSRAEPLSPLIARSSQWLRAPVSGVLRAFARLGDPVKGGQLLGVVADPFGANESEIRVERGGVLIGRTNLPVVYEGDALFHVARVEGTKVAARALDAFEPEQAYETGVTSELTDEPPIT